MIINCIIFQQLCLGIFHPAVQFIGDLYLTLMGWACCCRPLCRKNSYSLEEVCLHANFSHCVLSEAFQELMLPEDTCVHMLNQNLIEPAVPFFLQSMSKVRTLL